MPMTKQRQGIRRAARQPSADRPQNPERPGKALAPDQYDIFWRPDPDSDEFNIGRTQRVCQPKGADRWRPWPIAWPPAEGMPQDCKTHSDAIEFLCTYWSPDDPKGEPITEALNEMAEATEEMADAVSTLAEAIETGSEALIVTSNGQAGFDGEFVTKTGKVLTDDDIQALADEAEAGYDVSHLIEPGSDAADFGSEGESDATVHQILPPITQDMLPEPALSEMDNGWGDSILTDAELGEDPESNVVPFPAILGLPAPQAPEAQGPPQGEAQAEVTESYPDTDAWLAGPQPAGEEFDVFGDDEFPYAGEG
jgi:hypothetical protein